MAKVHYDELGKILSRLLENKNMSITDLAKETKLPVTTIHRIATGVSTRPYRKSLKPIADYFSISIEQLIGEEPFESITERNNVFPSRERLIEIPLIEWHDIELPDKNKSAIKHIIATSDLSINCFALVMNDASMEPTFIKGSVLIFDPEQNPKDRTFVLVKLTKQNIHVFRELVIDAHNRFIRPLNPDLIATQMHLLDDNDLVIGVLVESRKAFNRNRG